MLGPQTQLQLRPAAQSPIKLTGAAVEEAAKTNIFRSDWCQPWGGRRGQRSKSVARAAHRWFTGGPCFSREHLWR